MIRFRWPFYWERFARVQFWLLFRFCPHWERDISGEYEWFDGTVTECRICRGITSYRAPEERVL